jgi:arabinogalactan endo-1,4-beta-galactosidase
MKYLFWLLLGASAVLRAQAPVFYLGADLSYVNEMEDCGAVFRDRGQAEDPYRLFAAYGCNMARIRLWHTPAWQDTLGGKHRYSDFQDVQRSISRAKAAGMAVLLDIQLSDIWADPQRQQAPEAWQAVSNQLPALADSVAQYIYQTLMALHQKGLLPDMVQVGNETNRGIVLSYDMDARGWTMDWPRNAILFQRGLAAVRAAEKAAGKRIRSALHFANPAEAQYYLATLWNLGVRDYDVIGLSYYWAWHKPVTIAECGEVVAQLRRDYGKEVMIFETGYVWTNQSCDQAPNIISELHPEYSPASPENQLKWLVDLSAEVRRQGGIGVLYWEPAWVSTPCRTPWGTGSHQEHATFFDFKGNVLEKGGMQWFKQSLR